jgi:opine dehydrogenase
MKVKNNRLLWDQVIGLIILSNPEVGVIQGYMTENNYETGFSKAPGFKGILAQTQIDY